VERISEFRELFHQYPCEAGMLAQSFAALGAVGEVKEDAPRHIMLQLVHHEGMKVVANLLACYW
jgi:hypothetical protein